jgi:uncharacterized repeat protein (TIGR04138 family)
MAVAPHCLIVTLGAEGKETAKGAKLGGTSARLCAYYNSAMSYIDSKLSEVVQRDPRYAYEAYEFIDRALQHTQKMLGRVRPADAAPGDPAYHVSGRELLGGVRELALIEFGMMARTVFRMWGIERTDDFGNIVFNLISAGFMSRSDGDRLDDFHDVYDLEQALDYRIQLDEAR